jgi:hypothetical protein
MGGMGQVWCVRTCVACSRCTVSGLGQGAGCELLCMHSWGCGPLLTVYRSNSRISKAHAVARLSSMGSVHAAHSNAATTAGTAAAML